MEDYGQDLCPPYISGFIEEISAYTERVYPQYHQRVPTAASDQRAALRIIYGHAFKEEHESKAFDLKLK